MADHHRLFGRQVTLGNCGTNAVGGCRHAEWSFVVAWPGGRSSSHSGVAFRQFAAAETDGVIAAKARRPTAGQAPTDDSRQQHRAAFNLQWLHSGDRVQVQRFQMQHAVIHRGQEQAVALCGASDGDRGPIGFIEHRVTTAVCFPVVAHGDVGMSAGPVGADLAAVLDCPTRSLAPGLLVRERALATVLILHRESTGPTQTAITKTCRLAGGESEFDDEFVRRVLGRHSGTKKDSSTGDSASRSGLISRLTAMSRRACRRSSAAIVRHRRSRHCRPVRSGSPLRQ